MATSDSPTDMVMTPKAIMDHLKGPKAMKRRRFTDRYRLLGIEGNAFHGFSAMAAGKAVERRMITAIAGMLNLPLSESDMVLADPRPWDTPASVTESLLFSFREKQGRMVRNPESELRIAAEAIVSGIGHLNQVSGRDISDLDRGMEVMKRTPKEQAEILKRIHAGDPRAVQYVLDARGKQVGVSVLFATSDETREKLCNGRMSDADITQEHVLPQGRNLCLLFIAPLPGTKKINALARARAEIQTIFSQGGYCLRGVKPYKPIVYSVGGSDLLVQRMKRLGFIETGSNLKGYDKPMMILTHHSEARQRVGYGKRIAYQHLKYGLKLTSLPNLRKWREEDRKRKLEG